MSDGRSVWRIVGWAIVTAGATPGCMQFAPPFVAKVDATLAAGHAKWVPCFSMETTQFVDFVDSTVLAHRSYGGPIRTRDEVAVIVTRNSWVGRGAATFVDLNAIDGRSEVEEQDRTTAAEGTVRLPLVRPGDRVAVLPGRHVVVLSARSYESGKRDSHRDGQAQFIAASGGLYSLQVCRPKQGAVVFWVRDEILLTCASSACPRE